MKRKKINSRIEEKIVTAMITSKDYLIQIVPVLDINLFSAEHFRTIAQWCIKYFNKYQKPPEQHIENIFHSWMGKTKAKEETIDSIQEILEILSDNYEQEKSINIPYLLDETCEYFQLQKIERLRDSLEMSLLQNDPSIAESALNLHSKTVSSEICGIDILRDEQALKRAFADAQEPLFSMGNTDLNFFFAHTLARDNLIGILGREKIGKTYWCVELVIRALMNRKKVALFEVGDMSESQIIKRIGMRLVEKPMYKKHCEEPIRKPVKIEKRKDGSIKVKYKTKTFDKVITEKDTKEAFKKFTRRFAHSPEHVYYMTSIHSNFSVNISDINNILNSWELRHDFVPDVIIIDYADILADEPNTMGYTRRDKENVKWMALRRLSQERHCLVIAPTQADAGSYTINTLTASNFSEDKRKLAHVTGMIGLNQNEEDWRRSIMRLNWIVLREAPFNIERCLYVGQCLKLGRAFCCGYY